MCQLQSRHSTIFNVGLQVINFIKLATQLRNKKTYFLFRPLEFFHSMLRMSKKIKNYNGNSNIANVINTF
jgi:hypothetical protein